MKYNPLVLVLVSDSGILLLKHCKYHSSHHLYSYKSFFYSFIDAHFALPPCTCCCNFPRCGTNKEISYISLPFVSGSLGLPPFKGQLCQLYVVMIVMAGCGSVRSAAILSSVGRCFTSQPTRCGVVCCKTTLTAVEEAVYVPFGLADTSVSSQLKGPWLELW